MTSGLRHHGEPLGLRSRRGATDGILEHTRFGRRVGRRRVQRRVAMEVHSRISGSTGDVDAATTAGNAAAMVTSDDSITHKGVGAGQQNESYSREGTAPRAGTRHDLRGRAGKGMRRYEVVRLREKRGTRGSPATSCRWGSVADPCLVRRACRRRGWPCARAATRGTACAQQLGHVRAYFARGRNGAHCPSEVLDSRAISAAVSKAFGRVPIESFQDDSAYAQRVAAAATHRLTAAASRAARSRRTVSAVMLKRSARSVTLARPLAVISPTISCWRSSANTGSPLRQYCGPSRHFSDSHHTSGVD